MCGDCAALFEVVQRNLTLIARLAAEGGAGTPPDEDLPRIPDIQISARISAGGQGVVYAGVQHSTRRRVAIKVLRSHCGDEYAAHERFAREARLVAALRHPAIVTVLDACRTTAGEPCLIMEFVAGRTLDEWSAEQARSLPQILRAFEQIVDGVCCAHRSGIIHRDLKSSNVLVESDDRVRILDFGLARASEEVALDAFTTTPGTFVGTLAFAAPEQLTGEQAAVDVRSDLYSLGVVLYRLLTGAFPHAPLPDPREMLARRRNEPVRKPSLLARELPPDVDTVVLRLLATEAERRYPTANDLLRDVRHLLAGEPIEARRDEIGYRLARAARRYRIGLYAAAAMALVLTIATLMISKYASETAAERGRVRSEYERAQELLGILTHALAAVELGEEGRQASLVDFLDRVAEELSTKPPQAPRQCSELLALMSHVYVRIADPERAAKFCDRALEILDATADRPERLAFEMAVRATYLRWCAVPGNPELHQRARQLRAEATTRVATDDPLIAQLDFIELMVSTEDEPLRRLEQLTTFAERLPDLEQSGSLRDSVDYSRIGTLRTLGRGDEARALSDSMLSRLKGQGLGLAMQRLSVCTRIAPLDLDERRWEEALARVRPAIADVDGRCAADDPNLAFARMLEGIALDRLERSVEARVPLAAFIAHAQARPGPNREFLPVALDALVRGDLAANDDAAAAEHLRIFATELERRQPAYLSDLVKIERELARVEERRERFTAARTAIESALEHAAQITDFPDTARAELLAIAARIAKH